jgi:predicted transcriptional regulator
MTTLLDMAIEASRDLPAELQDELARIMLTFVNDGQEVYELTPAEESDLDEAEREVERGEIATEEEVRAMLAKYRL